MFSKWHPRLGYTHIYYFDLDFQEKSVTHNWMLLIEHPHIFVLILWNEYVKEALIQEILSIKYITRKYLIVNYVLDDGMFNSE